MKQIKEVKKWARSSRPVPCVSASPAATTGSDRQRLLRRLAVRLRHLARHRWRPLRLHRQPGPPSSPRTTWPGGCPPEAGLGPVELCVMNKFIATSAAAMVDGTRRRVPAVADAAPATPAAKSTTKGRPVTKAHVRHYHLQDGTAKQIKKAQRWAKTSKSGRSSAASRLLTTRWSTAPTGAPGGSSTARGEGAAAVGTPAANPPVRPNHTSRGSCTSAPAGAPWSAPDTVRMTKPAAGGSAKRIIKPKWTTNRRAGMLRITRPTTGRFRWAAATYQALHPRRGVV